MKIGLSLSRCISDICNNIVCIDDVYCIITGTKADNLNEWNRLLRIYAETVWYNNKIRAITFANILKESGRIVQPRNNDQAPPKSRDKVWIDIPHVHNREEW